MKKHCSNPACATKGTEIETKAERCVVCTKPLISPAEYLFDALYGGNPFKGG